MKREIIICLAMCLALVFVPRFSLAAQQQQYTEATPEWNQPFKPFRIIGNIYYVGANNVTSFLITTPQGHILLDSGFAETVPLIKESIVKLGFKLEDVKILINSHSHYDHAAGLAALKDATGAKLMISEPDATQIEQGGKGDFQWGDKFTFRPAKVDRLLRDNDKVELGGVTMTARITPGHTKGNTTWTMKVKEGDRSYDVVFVGSPTAPGYKLVGNANYPNINDDYAYTFKLLKSLPCDVWLSAHAPFFALERKAQRFERGEKPNPFIDPKGYRAFIDRMERDYLDQLKKQQAGR